MLLFGSFFGLILPMLCGLVSYRNHRSVVRATFAAIGGLFVLPVIVGVMCSAAMRPAPRDYWY